MPKVKKPVGLIFTKHSKDSLSDLAETAGGGYLALAAAIIHKAVQDYNRAAKSNNKNKYIVMKQLEEFFLSDWGQTLSLGQGVEIVRLCRIGAKEIIREKQRKHSHKNASARHK